VNARAGALKFAASHDLFFPKYHLWPFHRRKLLRVVRLYVKSEAAVAQVYGSFLETASPHNTAAAMHKASANRISVTSVAAPACPVRYPLRALLDPKCWLRSGIADEEFFR
jgi:hypothetical protein